MAALESELTPEELAEIAYNLISGFFDKTLFRDERNTTQPTEKEGDDLVKELNTRINEFVERNVNTLNITDYIAYIKEYTKTIKNKWMYEYFKQHLELLETRVYHIAAIISVLECFKVLDTFVKSDNELWIAHLKKHPESNETRELVEYIRSQTTVEKLSELQAKTHQMREEFLNSDIWETVGSPKPVDVWDTKQVSDSETMSETND